MKIRRVIATKSPVKKGVYTHSGGTIGNTPSLVKTTCRVLGSTS
jgi:hypothetical protein